ncbi:hypothetical protein RF11_00917 [Thelohanellus kitauei]|uniref:Uncharacterized protein n=1 Tax=Thelohanellus kitauei TaxID=669202 RepID=A0A0C2MEL2_THEKT|nr:hypothetical protein RF11_00917 [Thelohanellus kitauei]
MQNVLLDIMDVFQCYRKFNSCEFRETPLSFQDNKVPYQEIRDENTFRMTNTEYLDKGKKATIKNIEKLIWNGCLFSTGIYGHNDPKSTPETPYLGHISHRVLLEKSNSETGLQYKFFDELTFYQLLKFGIASSKAKSGPTDNQSGFLQVCCLDDIAMCRVTGKTWLQVDNLHVFPLLFIKSLARGDASGMSTQNPCNG